MSVFVAVHFLVYHAEPSQANCPAKKPLKLRAQAHFLEEKIVFRRLDWRGFPFFFSLAFFSFAQKTQLTLKTADLRRNCISKTLTSSGDETDSDSNHYLPDLRAPVSDLSLEWGLDDEERDGAVAHTPFQLHHQWRQVQHHLLHKTMWQLLCLHIGGVITFTLVSQFKRYWADKTVHNIAKDQISVINYNNNKKKEKKEASLVVFL